MLPKRLLLPIIIVMILAALVLFRTGHRCALVGGTSVPGNDVAASVSETDDGHSSSPTITITMRTPRLPEE